MSKPLYNALDDEAKEDLKNWIILWLLHKAGDATKNTRFNAKMTIKTAVDAFSHAINEGYKSGKFQMWIEKGLANENGKFQDWALGRIIKEGTSEFKSAFARNLGRFNEVLDARRQQVNTLTDQRGFVETTKSEIKEGVDSVKEWVKKAWSIVKAGTENLIGGIKKKINDLNTKSKVQPEGEIKAWSAWSEGKINGSNSSQNFSNFNRKLLQNQNRIDPSKIVEFEKKTGQKYGDYMLERGRVGWPEENVDKMTEYINTLKEQKKQAFEKMSGTAQSEAIGTLLTDIVERATQVRDPDAKKFTTMLAKHTEGGISFPELEEAKRRYEKNIKTWYYKDNNSVWIQRATNLDTEIRKYQQEEAIKQGFTNIKELNKEISNAYFLSNEIMRKQLKMDANNQVSLTDYLMLGAMPDNVGGFAGLALKMAMKNKSVKNTMLHGVARLFGNHKNAKEIKVDLEKIEKMADQKAVADAIGKFMKKWNIEEPKALPEAPKATVIWENWPQVKNPLTPEPMRRKVVEIDRRPKWGNVLGDTIARNAKPVNKRGENAVGLKTTKKTWNSEKTEYTTDDASNTASVSLTEKKNKVTWTKISSSWATARGWNSGRPTTDFSDLEKTKTKWEHFDLSGVKEEYQRNYDKIVNREGDHLEVGRIDWKVAYDGKERPAIFSQAIQNKIVWDHWLDKANLLATVNQPDYIIKNVDGKADKINIIKKIEWTNDFVLIGADRQNGYFILSNYEVKSRNSKRLIKNLSRWEVVIDNVGDSSSLNHEPKNLLVPFMNKSPKWGEKYQVAMDTISWFNKKKFLNSFQTDSDNPVHINAMKEMFKDEYEKLLKEYVWRYDFKPYKTALWIAKKRKEQWVYLKDNHYKEIKNPTLDDYKNEAIREREKFVLSRIKELYWRYLQDNGKVEIIQANKNLLKEYPTIEKEVLAKEGIWIDEYYDIKSNKRRFKKLLGEHHKSIKNRIETLDPIAEWKIKTEITDKNQWMLTALYKAWESNNATIKWYASSEWFDANHEYYDMKKKYVKEALDEWVKNKINDIEPLTFGDVLYFNFKDWRQMSFHRVVDDKSFEDVGTEWYVYKWRMIKREGGLFIWNEQIVNPLTLELEDYKKLYLENKEGIRYQKYWIADNTEKTLSAEEAKELKNFRNGRSVEEIAKDYGVEISIVDKITTPEGIRAYGKYGDGVITLAEKIKEGTAPHELFHATFDLVDSTKKESILEEVMKEKKLDKVQAEEYLADSFSEYFRTGRMKGEKVIWNVGKPLWKRIYDAVKGFFKQVKDWITGVSKNKNQIKKLFDDILDGEIDKEMLWEILGNKKETGTHRHQQSWPRLVPALNKSSSTTSLAGALERSSSKSITISPENANFYKNNLKQLWGKSHQYSPEIFLRDLKNSFGVEGNSSYIANNLSDWTHTLRISNHSAKAWNNKLRGHPENNTSIVIKLADTKFKRNKSVDLVEFVYNPENLTPEKMQGIIKGIQDWIDTGEYTDKNYDLTHKSIRATLEGWEVKYQLAYHGSPYDFEKFDSAHMGKWEGGQAHWWGHYVAVDKKTGERYANTLPTPKYQGKSNWQIPQGWVENSIISNLLTRLKDSSSVKEAIRKEKMLWNWYEKNERTTRGLKFLNEIKESDFEYQNKNLYEVEIPDPIKADTPTWSNYLEKEWAIKKDALNKIYDELHKYHRDNEKLATFKKRMDNWNIVDWETLQDSLSFVFQDDKAVSKFLESLWYDGIHYYWGVDWEAYVIFNDNKLEIKKHEKL